jgi:hypothetical protein
VDVPHSSVVFERKHHKERLGQIVERLLDEETREEGASQKVLILFPPMIPEQARLAD